MLKKQNSENRVNHNTTIDDDLWTMLRFLACSKKCGVNDLLEEGIEYLIDTYKDFLPKELRPTNKSRKFNFK